MPIPAHAVPVAPGRGLLYPWLLDTARVARSSVHARRLPKTVLTQVPGTSHTLHPM